MDWYLILMFVFTLWYILALVVSERVGKYRKIGEEWSFFISFMFSPLVGYIACLLSPKIK